MKEEVILSHGANNLVIQAAKTALVKNDPRNPAKIVAKFYAELPEVDRVVFKYRPPAVTSACFSAYQIDGHLVIRLNPDSILDERQCGHPAWTEAFQTIGTTGIPFTNEDSIKIERKPDGLHGETIAEHRNRLKVELQRRRCRIAKGFREIIGK